MRRIIHPATIVFSLTLIVYLWSAPQSVVFEDDGLFILSSYFNGISHPPGYPLFTLLGHLFSYVPVGSVAFRIHVVSALYGSLACVMLFYLARLWLPGSMYAAIAALAYGFSSVFWSQAIIAEVYTLNVLLFLALCLLAVHWERNRYGDEAGKILCLMGFIYGLGLSNHWPLLILSTPMLLLLMWPGLRMPVGKLLKPGFFMLLGLLPYAWMVWRSQMQPEISFYGPIESFEEFWFYVSRKGYVDLDINIGAGITDKLHFIFFTLKETARQFGYLTSFIVIVGLFVQRKYLPTHVCWALFLGYLGSTIVLVLLLSFNFDLLHINVYKVYPLISYAVTAIWLACGIRFLLENIITRSGKNISGAFLCNGVSFLLVLSVLLLNLPDNFRSNDILAEKYARTVLESLDENAVFFTYSDVDAGPLGYLNKIEKLRPDVLLMNANGYIFRERLFKPTLDTGEKYNRLVEYLDSEQRPIYFTRGIPDIYGQNDYGIYFRIDRELPKKKARAVLDDGIVRFYRELLMTEDLVDPWEYMIQQLMYSDYCRISTHFYLDGYTTYNMESLKNICRGYLAMITMVEVLLKQDFEDKELLIEKLQEARDLQDQAVAKVDVAKWNFLFGRLQLDKGNSEKALEYFRRSYSIWPAKTNQASTYIQQLHK